MIQILKCKSGKHELSMLIDDCAYCKIEQLKREIAATDVVVRGMKSIKAGTDSEFTTHFTTEQIHSIATEALAILDRTETVLNTVNSKL